MTCVKFKKGLQTDNFFFKSNADRQRERKIERQKERNKQIERQKKRNKQIERQKKRNSDR